jgi:uncharacterized protein YkwD
MKWLCAPVLLAVLSACAAAVPIPVSVPTTKAPTQSAAVTSADSFTTLINNFRGGQGVSPLRQSASLSSAAQAHADDMVARGYFSHRSDGGPNGETLMSRAQAAGCNARALAENIAEGQPREADVLRSWANSPGHRRNMLDTRMTDYGLGRAGRIWVLKISSGC